jgi:hypothetical protein
MIIHPQDTVYITPWDAQESGVLVTAFHYDAQAATTGWWPEETWDLARQEPLAESAWETTIRCADVSAAFLTHAQRVQQLMDGAEQGHDVLPELQQPPEPLRVDSELPDIITPLAHNTLHVVSNRYWDADRNAVQWDSAVWQTDAQGRWYDAPLWKATYAPHLIQDHALVAQALQDASETSSTWLTAQEIGRIGNDTSIGVWLNTAHQAASAPSVPVESLGGEAPTAWVSPFPELGVRLLTTAAQADRPALVRLRTQDNPPRTLWERALAPTADGADIHARTSTLIAAWAQDHPHQPQTVPWLLNRFWSGPDKAGAMPSPESAASTRETPENVKPLHPANAYFVCGALDDTTWVLWRDMPNQPPTLACRKDVPGQPPMHYASEASLRSHLQSDFSQRIEPRQADPPQAIRQQWRDAQKRMQALLQPPPVPESTQQASQASHAAQTASPRVPTAVHFALMPDDQYAAWVTWPSPNGSAQPQWVRHSSTREILTRPDLDAMTVTVKRLQDVRHWPPATLQTPPAALSRSYADQRQLHLSTMKDGWTIAWRTPKDREHPEFLRQNSDPQGPILAWAQTDHAAEQCRELGWTWQDRGKAPLDIEDRYLQERQQNPRCIAPQDILHYVKTENGVRTWMESPQKPPRWTVIAGHSVDEVQAQWAQEAPGVRLTEKQPPTQLTLSRLTHREAEPRTATPETLSKGSV